MLLKNIVCKFRKSRNIKTNKKCIKFYSQSMKPEHDLKTNQSIDNLTDEKKK